MARVRFKSAVEINPAEWSLPEMISVLGEYMRKSQDGKALWDVLVCLRGPDTGPKAQVDYEDGRDSSARSARENRKAQTAAIIRSRLFPKGIAGAAAQFNDDPDAVVILPPYSEWDHYDKHVFEACEILKISCSIGGKAPSIGGKAPKTGKLTFKVHGMSAGKVEEYLPPGTILTIDWPRTDMEGRLWVSEKNGSQIYLKHPSTTVKSLVPPDIEALEILATDEEYLVVRMIPADAPSPPWIKITKPQAAQAEKIRAKLKVRGRWTIEDGGRYFTFEDEVSPAI